MVSPGVCVGTLRHRRFSPVAHHFTYPLCMVLLDIERIPELMAASRLTGHNRWNWASFDDRDHLGDPSRPLRDRLAEDAAAQGIRLPGGPVLLLTQLRYLGYGFNPVSFYYCFNRRGALARVMAEVHNTYGGEHHYWLEPQARGLSAASTEPETFRATAEKRFYVSPFMPAALRYDFALTPLLDRFAVHMKVSTHDGEPPVFDATLSLTRQPWSAAALRRSLLRHPMMTAATIGAIHWQALKLWGKGVPVVPRPVVSA
jgi:DUF1365 family protein